MPVFGDVYLCLGPGLVLPGMFTSCAPCRAPKDEDDRGWFDDPDRLADILLEDIEGVLEGPVATMTQYLFQIVLQDVWEDVRPPPFLYVTCRHRAVLLWVGSQGSHHSTCSVVFLGRLGWVSAVDAFSL